MSPVLTNHLSGSGRSVNKKSQLATIKEKAKEISDILRKITLDYRGKVEIDIIDGVAKNVRVTESLDMR